jgi:hypothetical protein
MAGARFGVDGDEHVIARGRGGGRAVGASVDGGIDGDSGIDGGIDGNGVAEAGPKGEAPLSRRLAVAPSPGGVQSVFR